MLQDYRIMHLLSHRALVLTLLAALLGAVAVSAATLEKLSVEDMSRKSTAIVRGKVTSCQGEAQGSLILTRCRLQVAEFWKGALPEASFVIPGGSHNGLVQTISGTPRVVEGQEYVLFLWTGKSGKPQVIGLSQGLLDLATDAKTGEQRVRRAASAEMMLDSKGNPVSDSALDLTVSQLKARVHQAIAEARQ